MKRYIFIVYLSQYRYSFIEQNYTMIHKYNSNKLVAIRCYVKSVPLQINHILLLLLILLFFNQNIFADKVTEQDPVLKDYFNNHIIPQIHSPEVLKMADTLYNRASEKGNKYYLVLARIAVLDYYYFKGDKDQVLQLVPEIKNMCREYNEPAEYYFVWGSRLITFYLKSGMPNYALAEAQKMLRDAQHDNFLPGIAECYKAMANIYQMQSNQEQAAYNFKRLIGILNDSGNDDINLPVYYYSLINCLIQTNRMKEAEEALHQAQLYFKKVEDATAYQKLNIEQAHLAFYLKKKDNEEAKKVIDRIEKLFTSSKELAVFKTYLRESRLRYYLNVKDYSNALAMMDSIESSNPSSDLNMLILSKKGELYWDLNDKAKAAGYFRAYIYAQDSISSRSMQKSADEIAGLLNIRQLEQEKQQLKIDIQNRRLATTYWAIGTLIVILIIAGIVIVHIYSLNRQLKESKLVVEQQNNALLQSSEELRVAKDRAEEASCMKTDFIQNITHEVRTPLNSIVGFSQILAESYSDPETEEFASLITVNSNYLLRLFDDVLELSNTDQVESLPYNVVDDINASCLTAIKVVEPFVQGGVEFVFHPSEESMRILTNPSYVALILGSLLHNAAKFTSAGSITLDYSVSLSEGNIRYSVTDTGIGIPIDQCEAVFDRFKKLDSFTQGSGLGLSVARAIATKLGGALTVDTEYTVGARLVLILPFIPQ